MKSILLAIIMLMSTLTFSQKPFEGIITYVMQMPNGEIIEEFTMHFANDKLKIKTKGGNKNTLLIHLDSGIVYSIDEETKTYINTRLHQAIKKEMLIGKNILGYNTTPINKVLECSFFAGEGNTTFYYADNLYYPIPEKYIDNSELYIVQKQHIILRAEIPLNKYIFEEDDLTKDSALQNKIIFEAKNVISQPVSPEVFLIPNDYINEKSHDFQYKTSEAPINKAYMATTIVKMLPTKPVKKKTSLGIQKKKMVVKEQA